MAKNKTIELIDVILLDYTNIYIKYKNDAMLKKIEETIGVRGALKKGLISYREALKQIL